MCALRDLADAAPAWAAALHVIVTSAWGAVLLQLCSASKGAERAGDAGTVIALAGLCIVGSPPECLRVGGRVRVLAGGGGGGGGAVARGAVGTLVALGRVVWADALAAPTGGFPDAGARCERGGGARDVV